MQTSYEFYPDWVSPPGDTIADILEDRGISLAQFAEEINKPIQVVNELIQGNTEIDLAMARQLTIVLGASVEFWMSRDYQYWSDINRLKLNDVSNRWLSRLPEKEMHKLGWLDTKLYTASPLAACLHFFGVPSVQAWDDVYTEQQKQVAFRASLSFDSDPMAVAVWLRQGEIASEELVCKPWDADGFRNSLQQVRALTRDKNPKSFLPKLKALCAENGVAVALIRAPKECKASGATRFLSQEKALLLLSGRHLTDDHFWFTFFHEAGHLLLHTDKGLFVENAYKASAPEEQEANNFAAEFLIPKNFLTELLRLRPNMKNLVRFASQIGISPGIVVGQLQNHGKLRPDQLNGLKRRYKWEGQNLVMVSRERH